MLTDAYVHYEIENILTFEIKLSIVFVCVGVLKGLIECTVHSFCTSFQVSGEIENRFRLTLSKMYGSRKKREKIAKLAM